MPPAHEPPKIRHIELRWKPISVCVTSERSANVAKAGFDMSVSSAAIGGRARATAVTGAGSGLWWATLAILCVVLVAPLGVCEVPPLVDYPNHLARLFVLSSL